MKMKLTLFVAALLAVALSAQAQTGEKFAHNADHTILAEITSEPSGAEIYTVPANTNEEPIKIGTTPYTALVDLIWKRGWINKRWDQLTVWTPGDICRADYTKKGKKYDLYLHFTMSAPGYKSEEFGELIASFSPPDDLDYDDIKFIPSRETLTLSLTPEAGSDASIPEPVATNTVMIAGDKGSAADFGTVHIEADVDGADVSVDGKPAGLTPLKLIMRGGTHEIAVTKAGYAPYAKTMDVQAQHEVVLKVSLSEAAPAVKQP